MIATLTSALKGILGLNKKISEQEIECAIDENIVECTEMEEEPYTGVPAPVVLTKDPWFGSAPVSDANIDYMEREHEAFKQDALNYYNQETKESPNIHQEMYELATKSGATTLQLDPIGGSENFQGGSENVHR
tara:strand:+ start:248 stop:646 length:399 start_codon:yes stop_codon:yes gene_type:complete